MFEINYSQLIQYEILEKLVTFMLTLELLCFFLIDFVLHLANHSKNYVQFRVRFLALQISLIVLSQQRPFVVGQNKCCPKSGPFSTIQNPDASKFWNSHCKLKKKICNIIKDIFIQSIFRRNNTNSWNRLKFEKRENYLSGKLSA